MIWKTFSLSCVGEKHKKEKIVCQDSCFLRIKRKTLIGAVTDGAGSAKYSYISSKIIAENTVRELDKALNNIYIQLFINYKGVPAKIDNMFKSIQKKNLKLLIDKSKELNCSLEDLATTLICFIATPNWVAAYQIGDGFLVYRSHNESDYKLIFPPDKGEYINTTYFVTSLPQEKIEMKSMFIQTQPGFICASTDGLESLAIVQKNKQPFKPFFEAIENNFNKGFPENTWLKTWLRSDEQLNKKTNDDKTLLLGIMENV